jgi:hypothetical protein
MKNAKKPPSAPVDPKALRASLIASGLLREKPADFLIDEGGGKPFPKYRTRAMDDAAYFLREEDE